MGIHDREYYRDDTPSGVYMGQTTMVTKIVLVTFGIYLLDAFIPGESLMYRMASRADDLMRPLYWWRFLSGGFAHDPEQLNHILFNMAGLWFLGRSVEAVYGPKEILRFYLVAIVLGTLAQALREYAMNPGGPWVPCLGASGAVTAVIVLFIFHFPKQTLLLFFVLPVPAWVVGILIIGMNILGAGGVYLPLDGDQQRAARVAYDVHLVGAAFGFAYFYFKWNLGRLVPGNFSNFKRSLKPKPKLRVHDPEADYGERDADADRLLEKVNREGMESLNARERKQLEEYSRRMRQKHR
jgi:membrane associated rhomboid family serine protease